MFSGYYIPFVFVLLALIGRGVAFEFRGKVETAKWKNTWDCRIFRQHSAAVFVRCIVCEHPARHADRCRYESARRFYRLCERLFRDRGVAVTLLCLLHGLIFITLRTEADLRDRARQLAKSRIRRFGGACCLCCIIHFETDLFTGRGM